jgi:hypothetical protein
MAVVTVTPLALRILFVCGLLAAPLASCGGNSKHQSRGAGGSGGAAGTNAQVGGSSGSVSGGAHSAGGSLAGGRGGTAGGAAGASGSAGAGAGGSATGGSSGSGGAPSGGTSGNGGSAEAGAAGEGGAAGAPEPAVYSGCQYGSGAGRIMITKERDAKCTVLILIRPGSETLGLELPPRIGVQAAFRSGPGPGGCFIYSPPTGAAQATSGSGTIPQLALKLDVDVTLHFPAEEVPPSETLTVQDLDIDSRCP